MSLLPLEGKLLRWGNSYGIRLSKADVERLGLHPNGRVRVLVEQGKEGSWHDWPAWDLGGAADRHDELFGQASASDLEGRRP